MKKSENYNPERYTKQILFTEIGAAGQRALAGQCAVIVGCGALGSTIANSVVRSGVGRVKIVDRDFVELSNLQRQILFDEDDVRNEIPKAIAAKRRLQKINSGVEIDAVVSDLDRSNVDELIKGADIVLDGLDNFETRFILNDYCVREGIPWVYGACVGSAGLSMNIIPKVTPCLRCIFDAPPPPGLSPTCDTDGIIAPIVNIVASIQVAEALKVLVGDLDAANKYLIRIDVWNGKYDKINVQNAGVNTGCPACKEGVYEFLLEGGGPLATTLCGRHAVQIKRRGGGMADFGDIAQRLRSVGDVHYNDFMLKFKIDGYEITLFDDRRAIILGTSDKVTAKNLYSRYIGM